MRVGLGLGITGIASLLAVIVGCSDSVEAPASPDAGGDPSSRDGGAPKSDGDVGDAGRNPPEDAGQDGGTEPSGPPAVRWVGRTDTRDPAGPRVAWAGTRILVRFQGTRVTAKVTERNIYTGPSGYDVLVDGTLAAAPFVPNDGDGDYVLVDNLPAGVHVLELHRRTEGIVGVTQFRGFEIGDGQLLAPPAALPRRIETIGDSASSGYGVDCASAAASFTGRTQDERKSYPALAARALGAEHVNVSFSGKGVMRNYDATDTDMFPSIYLRSLPEDPDSTWDFSTWKPDVVLLALGGNDFDNPGGRPPPDLTVFKAKYHELVTLVRAKNPNAQIACTVAAGLTDDYPPGYAAYTNVKTILGAVVAERKLAPYNDPKVHYLELPRADSSGVDGRPDLTGCEGHANAAFHQKLATDVVTKLKAITGW